MEPEQNPTGRVAPPTLELSTLDINIHEEETGGDGVAATSGLIAHMYGPGNGNGNGGSRYRPHFVFAADENARTTDPEVMKRNYQLSFYLHMVSPHQKVTLDKLEKDGILCVSPEFGKTLCNGKYESFFKAANRRRRRHPNGERMKSDRIEYRMVDEGNAYFKGFEIMKALRKKSKKKRDRRSRNALRERMETSNEQRSIVNNSDSLIVAEFKEMGLGVSLRSIQRLAPQQELDDDLVDFGIYNLLKDDSSIIYIRGSTWLLYFFTEEDPIPEFRRKSFYKIMTKRGSDLLNKKLMVIPVCREAHWLLVIISNPFPPEHLVNHAVNRIRNGIDARQASYELYNAWTDYTNGYNSSTVPLIFVLDSKFLTVKRTVGNPFAFHNDTVRFILKGLRYAHQVYWENSGNGIIANEETFRWFHELNLNGAVSQMNNIHHYSLDVPEQQNGKDCGLFVMKYVEAWLNNRCLGNNDAWMIGKDCTEWFHPGIVSALRHKIYSDILERCRLHHPNNLTSLIEANPFLDANPAPLPIKQESGFNNI